MSLELRGFNPTNFQSLPIIVVGLKFRSIIGCRLIRSEMAGLYFWVQLLGHRRC